MDPDEALKNAREAAALILDSSGSSVDDAVQGHALAEAFDALDGWLSKGGFLPDAWKTRRRG